MRQLTLFMVAMVGIVTALAVPVQAEQSPALVYNNDIRGPAPIPLSEKGTPDSH